MTYGGVQAVAAKHQDPKERGRTIGERRRGDEHDRDPGREAVARRWLMVLGFVFDVTVQRTDANGDEWQPDDGDDDMLDAQDAYHDLIVLARDWLEGGGAAYSCEPHEASLSRFNVAAILRSDRAAMLVRRELRHAFPSLSPSMERVRDLISSEVLKREVVEGEKAGQALKHMRKSNRPLRKRTVRKRDTAPKKPTTGAEQSSVVG